MSGSIQFYRVLLGFIELDVVVVRLSELIETFRLIDIVFCFLLFFFSLNFKNGKTIRFPFSLFLVFHVTGFFLLLFVVVVFFFLNFHY